MVDDHNGIFIFGRRGFALRLSKIIYDTKNVVRKPVFENVESAKTFTFQRNVSNYFEAILLSRDRQPKRHLFTRSLKASYETLLISNLKTRI